MTVKRARFHCWAVWLSFVFDFKQLLKYSGQFLVRHAHREYFLYSLACLCTVLMVFFHKLVFYVSLLLRGQLLISASQRGPPVSSGPPNANCRLCPCLRDSLSRWKAISTPAHVLPEPHPGEQIRSKVWHLPLFSDSLLVTSRAQLCSQNKFRMSTQLAWK